MDLALYFLIAFLMAIGTIIIGKIYGKKSTGTIKGLLALAIILPMILIALFGMLDMMNTNPEETQEIADKTITKIVDYAAERLPYIVVSDVAGIFAGALLAPFIESKKR